jgi:oxygen-dependent protoporphyrinogen oxidase
MRRIAIIGGGIAGLTAAYELARLARAGAPIEAVLFEASNRVGGIIETVREGGFTAEAGPDGWVTAKPWARELAVELGLADELISSNDATRKTWVYLSTAENPSGRLVPMPDSLNMMVPTDLGALDGSPLFTDAAIAAYRDEPTRAAELLAAIPAHDESIADFTLRHFGPEVLERVAAPLLSGVFGGDVRTLSVRAIMPAFVEMERRHGSLIAALQSAAHRQPSNEAPSIFTSLRSGLGTLIDRIAGVIPQHWLRLNTTVTALRPTHASSYPTPHTSDRVDETDGPNAPRWTVSTSSKHLGPETFDAVFLATPLDATRRLLAPLDPHAAGLLPTESSSAVLVAFCFSDATRVPVPSGFGFLVPPKPGAPHRDQTEEAIDPSASLLLACTFADQKYPHRVPSGGRLVRAFFGGAAAERLARCNNDEIAAIARLELARILYSTLPISAAPTPAPVPAVTVIRRLPNSLPQYAVGHLGRIAELESRLSAQLPGLTLLGNALHGVGIPDLIRDSREAARAAARNQLTTEN